MKLLNFPLLVQKEILHNIEYQNLFLLSFVSKKTKNLIKSSQKKRFESINSIVYDDNLISNGPLVYIPYKDNLNRILILSGPFENDGNDWFQLKLSGKIIDFRHFQGRQADVTSRRCKIIDLVNFVRRWKSGKAFQNLEYLKVEITEVHVPGNQILNEIGTKYIDGAKMPPTHTLPKVYIGYHDDEPNTDPISRPDIICIYLGHIYDFLPISISKAVTPSQL
ncbi:unnamed protein product [Caenorhabditis nigoni]